LDSQTPWHTYPREWVCQDVPGMLATQVAYDLARKDFGWPWEQEVVQCRIYCQSSAVDVEYLESYGYGR
jgi:hypothetical protein